MHVESLQVVSRISQLSSLYRFWNLAFVSETQDMVVSQAIIPPGEIARTPCPTCSFIADLGFPGLR